MQDNVAYGILEMAYISQIITEVKDYEKVLEKELPCDWYRLSVQDRIAILNEAISNGLRLTETSLYLEKDERNKVL